MDLLCRDKEKVEISEILNTHDVLLISGKSGVGKTRIAIEVGRDYASSHNYLFKCIQQNGEPIYEDLKTHFSDDNNYIVLVDDANQLAHLQHLLNICVDSIRKHKMKILLTVRDYSKEFTLRRIREVIFPGIYTLNPLEADCIKTVLQSNLKINNTVYIDQILKIASGNLRLAIMVVYVLKKVYLKISEMLLIYTTNTTKI